MRAVWRLSVAAFAFVLSACARDPIVSPTANTIPSGNWKIEQQIDRITGKPISSAYLNTRSSSHTGQAFQKPAIMNLGCFRGEPIVRMAFSFKIGSNRNSSLGYRFDDKPGREIEARFLADYTTAVIEDPAEVWRFIEEMRTSGSLYVLIRSLNAGRTSAEFDVQGAPAAIDAALASCPLKPPAPPPSPPRKRRS